MKAEKLEFFKEFAYKALTVNRLTGSEGHKKAYKLIESYLEDNGCRYEKEAFKIKSLIPKEAWVEVEGKRLNGVAPLGSKGIEIEAFVKRNYIEGDIALIPDLTKEKAIEAQKRGAVAIITYREGDKLDEYIYGNHMGVDIPIICLLRKDIAKIEDYKAKLFIRSSEETLWGKNLIMEVGRGPVVYLVAHMDTVHGIYGSIGNGIGALLLIFLYQELKERFGAPYKLRFLITDGRELGLAGSRFHLREDKKHVFYCINIEGVGWYNPCVIYEDMYGYNGERINQMFYKHLKDMRVNLNFCKAKERDGDHIPFKEKGFQTLFLSSHPFTIRHTQYDNYEAINWDGVVLWYEIILSFLRRLGKL